MDEAPINLQRIKTACEQLQACALEFVENPVDQLAKKVEFAAQTRAITLLFLAVQLRDHLAEAGMVASGLRVCVRANKQNQDCITCPWQVCVDGQWGTVPDHALARQALEGINRLLGVRKPLNKRESQARNTGTRGLGLIEQTIISMT